MNFRPLLAASVLTAGWSVPAFSGFENHYAALLGETLIPDSARDSREGYGFVLVYGIPLSPMLDLELRGGNNFLSRKSTGENDSFTEFSADAKLNIFQNNAFKPYVLGGIGAGKEAEGSRHDLRPFGDFGVGLTHSLFSPRLLLRAETRYHLVFAGSQAQSKSYSDVALNLGLQLAFGRSGASVHVSEAPDSDKDGVVDALDRCPNTPAGVPVDASGCPALAIDSDSDGVIDALDRCPGTPPDSLVDGNGCLVMLATSPTVAPAAEVAAVPAPLPPAAPVEPPPAPVPATETAAITPPPESPAKPLDSDGDGVLDDKDRCPNTPLGLLVDAYGCLIEQTTVLPGVQFESNSDRLTPEAIDLLKTVAASLKLQPNVTVEISGHTDSLGPQANNLTLSIKRAKAVKMFLVSQGIAETRLASEGYGEFIPIDTNETEAGRAQNRRVEFKVQQTPAP